ncbi:MAG TPA: NADH-quinone oxidoreductase subunit NuoH [Gemmatimonadaceae bacterium]|nr:NADH-quinone oxidoreductase subunit NuoH [Gemmatimonadaceae bacterium]
MTHSLLLLLQVADPQQVSESTGFFLVTTIVKMLVFFTIYLVGVALLTLAERKVSAWIQDRHGPNRVGPGGLLQPAADGLKNIMKEETYPGAAYKPLFVLAPVFAFVPALITWSVIPFASPLPTPWGLVPIQLADLPIGFLFILAISSLGVYGIVIAGWSSNNKYSLLGGLRASAQMISYEVSLGLAVIPVLLLAGNVTLNEVIWQQATGLWNVLNLTVAFFIFMVAALAETNRLPFDLPEAESELIAGYHTEYSAMKFSMFFIAEYANIVTISALMAVLFFGGWDIPITGWENTPPWSVAKTLATGVMFALKVLFFIFTFIWIRWTLPRFRYDQLMSLGWKFMLPLALAYIVLIAGVMLGLEASGIHYGPLYGLALFAVNLATIMVLFVMIDHGRIISPAYGRLATRDLEKLKAYSDRALFAAEQPAVTAGSEDPQSLSASR